MRIGLVSAEYPPDTAHGGIASQTYRKAHGLTRLGHAVHVISRSADGQYRRERDDDVDVTRLGDLHGGVASHTDVADWITHSTQIATELARAHAESPYDIIEFAEYGAEGYVYLLNRTEWNRVPVVVQLHGPLAMLAHEIGWPAIDSDLYRVGTHMEATCVRLADGVYSSSATSADWCAAKYGRPRRDFEVLHSGVDVGAFRPGLTEKDDRPTIVFVGRIARSKGVDALVEAALSLAGARPGLRVRLIGSDDDDLGDQLLERAAAAGHPDLLEFRGFVRSAELPKELGRAHVFAAPSIYEGGPGLVYLEAMACGVPVVACNGSGVEEIISDGVSGALVPPGDHDALVATLGRLIDDRAIRDAMGEAGRRFVVEHADTRECMRRLEALYVRVATPQVEQ
ncbi:MAG: glycogen synthase [Microbacteriaceae bacterium]|nr:glycogen synthase [Microbacteriaceae bacterium]